MKKILSLSLVLVMLVFVFAPTSVNASSELKEVQQSSIASKEEILSEYHTKIAMFSAESNARALASTTQQKDEIKEETINKLIDAGYEAYDVNPETFDEVEEK